MRQVKKGVRSEASNYITKGKAMRRLQLGSKQFHRLCILKGIFPREPKKRTSNKTYYHVKDVRFLAHEKLLDKFREIDAWMKKVRKAKVRGDETKAKAMTENQPTYSLHHLVKERYPAFSDALSDLDDALTLICLFASCPSNSEFSITHHLVRESERLWREFCVYLVAARSLRKSFLSVKGIYYQADVKGTVVTWLVPYQFTQNMPQDVDYSVMTTFLEFYHTLLRFVNYKLYSELELTYPPDLNTPVETLIANCQQPTSVFDVIEIDFMEAKEMQAMKKAHDDAVAAQRLFDGFVFLLGRETPKYSLELVIRACGGRIALEDGEEVTHQIVDRPIDTFLPTREYLQPQWVYDCVNFKIRLPLAPYRPNQPPPPHLSPFVDSRDEEYVPQRLTEILQLKGEPLPTASEPAAAEDKSALGKLIMPKKIRKLYQTMQYGLRKKKALIEKLKKNREAKAS